jgi:alkanesulfonate monooxygenase SsuD/methylene tetrahydromethanopterin reductase-like flavin-dependent oxidoreductase (luciferase family)
MNQRVVERDGRSAEAASDVAGFLSSGRFEVKLPRCSSLADLAHDRLILLLRQFAGLERAAERGPFVGTPAQVAQQIDDFVQNDGSDGLIIGSHLVPWGLDEFVDEVVPLLQERGSLRAEYTSTTLRDNLGRPPLPRGSARRVAAAGE